MSGLERRSQEQRRFETRLKLLDAALAELVEKGYARLTTPEVCARAGLSQGALFKHFPTKQELMVAAVEHLYGGLREEYRLAFRGLNCCSEHLDLAIDRLWEIFNRPETLASFEMQLVSRVEPELNRAFGQILDIHWSEIRKLAAELVPDGTANPRFEVILDLVIVAIQGGAISQITRPDPKGSALRLQFLKSQIIPLLIQQES